MQITISFDKSSNHLLFSLTPTSAADEAELQAMALEPEPSTGISIETHDWELIIQTPQKTWRVPSIKLCSTKPAMPDEQPARRCPLSASREVPTTRSGATIGDTAGRKSDLRDECQRCGVPIPRAVYNRHGGYCAACDPL